ncbi:MAG: BON domain-containing protein [Bacillota bacterium]|nr:BON domain-containing protein [Bacillota bacterium]MDW7682846.1 BON domain-containing protein [Bacillota bacterium]
MMDKGKQAPNNERLSRELYDAFHSVKEFKGYDINVRAQDGHVNLQGVVDVLADVTRATRYAQDFPGVKSVENDLTISTDGAINDDDVYMEVTQEIGADPRVDEEKVHFTVKNGVVSLHGEVETHEEREAAALASSKARGVRSVNNQIEITGDLDPGF